MKHLIEAERESSVPSSNSKKTSDGLSIVLQQDGPFEMITRDTNSVCHERHRVAQITLSGRPNSNIDSSGENWRLARSGDFFI